MREDALASPLVAGDLREAMAVFPASDRTAFVAGRAVTRVLLGRYLDVEPTQMVVVRHADSWVAFASGRCLRFSTAVAEGLQLLAIHEDREVILSLESIDPGMLVDDLAKTYLDVQHAWEILTARGDERIRRFYELWTVAEVSTAPNSRVFSLDPGPGYAAAVAIPRDYRLEYFDWLPLLAEAAA